MAGGGGSSQTNGARDQRAMEEGRKDEFAGDRGCAAAISIPFVQKVRHRAALHYHVQIYQGGFCVLVDPTFPSMPTKCPLIQGRCMQ